MEFIDLKKQYKYIKYDIDKNINKILNDAKFIDGEEVSFLESKLAEYVGRKYCITCGNGTDALQLVYMSYGVKKGDAVFCPDMTFIASIEPACMFGATPIFCDIDDKTYNISPYSLEKSIKFVIDEGSLRPKIVVAVDFLGNPADYKEIMDICKKYDLILIEDAAQSIGSIYDGKKCGSFGNISTTSFFPSKPLGCYGDGGAIFTDDEEIYSIINSLKVHGRGPNGKYDNIRIGINSRLDTIQAGILLSKLRVLDEEIYKRQIVAERYDNAFRNIIKTPTITKNSISSYAQYCILLKDEIERNKIVEKLNEYDIPSLIYYPKQLHLLDAFSDFREYGTSNCKKYSQCNLGLPFSPYLSKEDQDLIINVLLENILQ